MSMFGYDDFEDRSHLVVLAFVVAAVLALGYYFREGLLSLFEQDYSAVSAAVKAPVGVEHSFLASAVTSEPGPLRTEPAVNGCPGGENPSSASAAHTEQAETVRPQVTLGYYLALSDTPVRAAPTSSAETVAFVYQGQRFLVVRSSGHYVEIRSISRDRQNPPGFVLRGDVKSMKEVEPHMLVSVRRALDE